VQSDYAYWVCIAALFYRLKGRAFAECSEYSKAYMDCCKGRVISVVWSCREESRALSTCLGQFTSRLEDLKAKWVKHGCKLDMDEREWNCLLDELIHDA